MKDETRVTAHIHMEGPASYCCDQDGDSATINLGRGLDVGLTASIQDFLILAEVCKETATRIAMKLSKEGEAPA